MRGGEGVGKGTLAKALQRLIGHHALAVSNAKHLVGNFNAHLRDCVFLFADEAFFAGDKAHVSVLKTLITEDQIAIEGKGRDVVHAPNFLHLMMASNEEWVVPASLDSRRFFMLDVPSTKKGDHAHFNAIWEQLESGGLAAMLHDLLAMDLSLFDVRAVPVTDALQEQRKLSMPTAEAWWAEVLARGYVFQSEHGNDRTFREWREQASTELLFASYQTFAKGHGERHPMSRETLGKFLAKVGGTGGKKLPPLALIGESRDGPTVNENRANGYWFGPLAHAREAFAKVTGLTFDWEAEETDEVAAKPAKRGNVMPINAARGARAKKY